MLIQASRLKQMDIIPYGTQKIEEEDVAAVVNVLRTGALTQGSSVQEFENTFSDFLKNVSNDPSEIYSLAVNNGTTALHLCALALV